MGHEELGLGAHDQRQITEGAVTDFMIENAHSVLPKDKLDPAIELLKSVATEVEIAESERMVEEALQRIAAVAEERGVSMQEAAKIMINEIK